MNQVRIRGQRILQLRGEPPAGIARQAILRREDVRDASVAEERMSQEARIFIAPVPHHVCAAVEVQHDVQTCRVHGPNAGGIEEPRRPRRAEGLRLDVVVESRAAVERRRGGLQHHEALALEPGVEGEGRLALDHGDVV